MTMNILFIIHGSGVHQLTDQLRQLKSDLVISSVSSLASARKLLGSQSFDVLIADSVDTDGCVLDLCSEYLAIPLIYIAGDTNEADMISAFRHGAADVLLGNWDDIAPGTLLSSIEQVNKMWACIKSRIALHEVERIYDVFQQINHPICVTNSEGHIEFANASFIAKTGATADELLSENIGCVDLFQPALSFGDASGAAVADISTTCKIRCADGHFEWAKIKVYPYVLLEATKCIVLVNTDISESEEMQQSLYQEKELLNVTVQSIRDGVISVNKDGYVVMVNKAACEVLGLSEDQMLGQLLQDIMKIRWEGLDDAIDISLNQCTPTQSKSVFGQVVLGDDPEMEQLLQLDMNTLHGQDDMRTGAVLVFRDVTRSEQIDRELRRLNRLESINLLAGGIAHDFRNILTPVLGDISLAKESLPDDHPLRTGLTRAERGCQRAANLATQLLIFARGGTPVRHPMNLGATAVQSGEFATSGSNCEMVYDIEPGLWAVDADEGQMFQVLHNLIINARIALADAGNIYVRMHNCHLDEGAIPLLKEGRYVRIEVEDKGPGISPDVISLIFDPFFTTRPDGRGLGLAIVFSIVRNHDGVIQVESVEGEGALFTVYLPATDLPTSSLADTNSKMVKGTGRILMMDDEVPILEFMTNLVTKLGYEPITSENGEQAIAHYKEAMEQNRKIDLVIMDLTIPNGMGGRETISELLRIDPDVNAIVASGYSNDPILADPKSFGFKGAITKPFRIKEMSALIAKVLSERNNE